MANPLKPLHQQVMVITGATSGIGLATALAAARRGTKLVLAARNEEELEKVVQQVKNIGSQAISVVADVGKREDLQKIADAAIERFNSFDTWVNNTGTSIYGRLEEVSEEDHRRLFDTNFWSVVNGSLIAARHLKGHGGAIINLGSVVSDVAMPLQGMYAASKHAIKGFTDAFRIELEEEDAPVSLTLVKPGSINTPLPEHAKKYTDKQPMVPPPAYEAEEVARAILYAATHPRRDIFVGSSAKLMSSLNKYAPAIMDWISEKVMFNQQQKDRPAHQREGSLHSPMEDGSVDGNYPGYVRKKSFYTRASMNSLLTGAVVAASAAAIVLMRK